MAYLDRHCHQCGQKTMVLKVPSRDTLERKVCETCDTVLYENPKVVVGVICEHEGKLLLCRRAIEPQVGLWTYPAGFLELNESTQDGAAREAMEEANAHIEIDYLVGHYSLTHINQVHLIYYANMTKPDYHSGDESLEVELMAIEDIPWDELAFPVIRWSLKAFLNQKAHGHQHVDSKTCSVPLEQAWDIE